MARTTDLTLREYEVLWVYAKVGHSGETATQLGLSVQTVRNHLNHIYLKLDVHSAIEALVAVGWVNLPKTRAELRKTA